LLEAQDHRTNYNTCTTWGTLGSSTVGDEIGKEWDAFDIISIRGFTNITKSSVDVYNYKDFQVGFFGNANFEAVTHFEGLSFSNFWIPCEAIARCM
jgi:hypothetical protein